MEAQQRNKVYKSLHKPLTILGIERRMFVMSVVLGVSTFQVTDSLLAGIMIFAGCAVAAYWATKTDPAMLTIIVKVDRFKRRYDAGKQQVPNVEIR